MKKLIILLAIISFFIFPPIIIVIIIALYIKSLSNYKGKTDCALSALTVKYIYDNMSEKEKAKIDYEVNHIAYEQYIKGTSLEAGMNYDEAIKLSKKTLMTKKRTSPWGYWLFLANVFAECQVPNPFGNKWYTAKFPFKELVGEEKYAIKGMQDFLRDTYRIEVNMDEINNSDSVFPFSPMPNIDDHSTFEKQLSKPNKTEKYVSKDQYQTLEKKFGEQGQELEELRNFFEQMLPLHKILQEKPEITEAILSGKFNADLAKAVLEGKVKIEDTNEFIMTNKEANDN